MERLDGRTAVVTGAASGIGLAVSAALAAEGVRVLMTDLDADAVGEQADRLAAGGARVHATAVDVRDPADVERVADEAVARFGGLHVAVNNAGIVNRGRSWELPLEEWHRVLDVDLWGAVHGVRAFVPRILATGEEGHVVFTGSMATVAPLAKLGPYSVAKHGLLGLADVLRAELEGIGAPVGVSLVMPGAIRTGMNPHGTVTAEQVAANVVDGIRRRRAYVFTDDHSTDEVAARLGAIVAARDDVLA
ncbi:MULTISPECIES: SDR family NAD(P)-dependent oxidoreductase [unclassified Blastococcus]